MLTDGPFVGTKEHLLGIYLIDVPNLDTALDWSDGMPFPPSAAPWRSGTADAGFPAATGRPHGPTPII